MSVCRRTYMYPVLVRGHSGAGATLGPQNNEKRWLTPKDVEKRSCRSATVFDDY